MTWIPTNEPWDQAKWEKLIREAQERARNQKPLDGGGRCYPAEPGPAGIYQHNPYRETPVTKEDGELFRQLVEVRVALRKAALAKYDADIEYNRLITERDAILSQLKGE
jgi:hypothetical protein